jgi:hypothetical protein
MEWAKPFPYLMMALTEGNQVLKAVRPLIMEGTIGINECP